jgi:hypothetical protein
LPAGLQRSRVPSVLTSNPARFAAVIADGNSPAIVR